MVARPEEDCMLIMMGLCFVDNVPFGEVAMAPPSLSSKPKKAQPKSQVTRGLFVTWDASYPSGLAGGLTCFRLLPPSRRHRRSCFSTLSLATPRTPQASPPWPGRGSWRRRGSGPCRPTVTSRNRGSSCRRPGLPPWKNSSTFDGTSCPRMRTHKFGQ